LQEAALGVNSERGVKGRYVPPHLRGKPGADDRDRANDDDAHFQPPDSRDRYADGERDRDRGG
jgi:hypothetical protein